MKQMVFLVENHVCLDPLARWSSCSSEVKAPNLPLSLYAVIELVDARVYAHAAGNVIGTVCLMSCSVVVHVGV